MVVEGPEDTYQVVRTLMGATNPVEAAPGTIRGDLAIETEREPGPRLGLARVGRPGDRALLSRSGLRPGLPAGPTAVAARAPADQATSVRRSWS